MSLDDVRHAGYSRDQLDEGIEELRGKLFVPHSGGQAEVLATESRFKVIAAGRRWGKTKAAAREIVRGTLKPDSMNWWVANSYKNVRRGYREVVRQVPADWLAKPAPISTSNELILQFRNGAMVEFYSAGNPDALAGEGNDLVIVDEAGLIPDAVWYQLIRPTLMDKLGRAFIISTPRGRNWFYRNWLKGQGEAAEQWRSWRFPQMSNPHVPDEETAEAKLELPEVLFRQEILAEFLAAGTSIFGRGLERKEAVLPFPVEPRGDVFMGIDLAKSEDFTVISASRGEDRLPCYRERISDLSWPAQRQRIKDAVAYIEGHPGVTSVVVMIDSTGLGDVVYDDLMDEGLFCEPVKFTNDWKDKAVRLLASHLEQGHAHILEDQREEFEAYSISMTEAGRIKYEASEGHDDEVSAKLLEHWGLNFNGAPTMVAVGPEADEHALDAVLEEQSFAQKDAPSDIMGIPGAWTGGFERSAGLRIFTEDLSGASPFSRMG